MDKKEYIEFAIQAAVLAGQKIIEVYNSDDFEIELKSDFSPLTKADRISHSIISEILKPSGLPILSEEGKEIEYLVRKKWNQFWLIDPIDGTKEFISRNGEFTVNIALVSHEKPIVGVIYVPVTSELYVGKVNTGAYKIVTTNSDITFSKIVEEGEKLPLFYPEKDFVIVGSRSFMNNETRNYINKLMKVQPNAQILSKGSSLKICMVAEGQADVYPRFGPTMEWDTAAGHAIVKASGKNIFLPNSDSELSYNKMKLLNPHFIVI